MSILFTLIKYNTIIIMNIIQINLDKLSITIIFLQPTHNLSIRSISFIFEMTDLPIIILPITITIILLHVLFPIITFIDTPVINTPITNTPIIIITFTSVDTIISTYIATFSDRL